MLIYPICVYMWESINRYEIGINLYIVLCHLLLWHLIFFNKNVICGGSVIVCLMNVTKYLATLPLLYILFVSTFHSCEWYYDKYLYEKKLLLECLIISFG